VDYGVAVKLFCIQLSKSERAKNDIEPNKIKISVAVDMTIAINGIENFKFFS
jgi:hypothetical protein